MVISSSIQISVVIPIYNSEATLEELYKRLTTVLSSVSKEYEIFLVDDCSEDHSWQKMQSLHEKDERVKIIQLTRNFGQHNAIMCGFHFVKGEYIITMDDDLQNPPEEIPKLIDKIKEGYDVVYGEYMSKRHSLFRNLGSTVIQKFYQHIFNVKHNLTTFRIINNDVVKSILTYDRNYTFIDGLIAWHTNKIGSTPVYHNERDYGKSVYSLGKLLVLSLNMLTNFSIIPLQIASLFGIVFSGLGFLMSIFFFIKKVFVGIPVSGYTSLIVVVTFFCGVQLLTIGLIGEYIGRIHININRKPQFKIRDKKI